VIDLASDLAAIYAGPEVAKSFRRVRPSAADVTVRMIIGTVDDEVLEQKAIAVVRKASFMAGQDVKVDDKVEALEAIDITMPAGTVLRILDQPKRVNDGLEVEALLGSATL